MAKISARNCYQIAAVNCTMPVVDGDEIEHWDYRFVLRSDGKVLRRSIERYYGGGYRSTTYKVWATISDPALRSADFLRRALERKGYTVTKVEG